MRLENMVHHKSQGSLPKVIVGLRNKRAYCSVPSLAGGYCQDEKLKIISASLTTSGGDWFYLNLGKTLMRTFRQQILEEKADIFRGRRYEKATHTHLHNINVSATYLLGMTVSIWHKRKP
ncbi:hypothetical protein V1478_000856 [Vespula squamosa]|uniref:Uncharacterized protein n=1 Tax=Vespula squamosa TaxID=30214 RepID=A0ABD2C6Q0_VESSQ